MRSDHRTDGVRNNKHTQGVLVRFLQEQATI